MEESDMLKANASVSLLRAWQWVRPVNCFASRNNLCVASHKLFKQIKQNFPLRYFYGESANSIKIQVRVTIIANLLLMVMQKRIMLMYYVNLYTFLEDPEKDWAKLLSEANPPPEGELLLFCWEGLTFKRIICNAVTTWIFHRLLTFSGQQWLKIFNRATESRHPSSIQGIIHPRGGKWRVPEENPVHYLSEWVCSGIYNPHPFSSQMFQENDLDGTKREYYATWYQENVLDSTKSWLQQDKTCGQLLNVNQCKTISIRRGA